MFRQSSAPWYTPQGWKALLPGAGVLFTLASLLSSLLLALVPANPDTEDPGDADTGYVQPDLLLQDELEQIRVDINSALVELRFQESVPPTVPAPHLQLATQLQVERSAVAGHWVDSPNNVTAVRHRLPVESASGHAFMEAWLHSPEHTAALLDTRPVFSAVGVAVGHGEVWVSVQLSAR